MAQVSVGQVENLEDLVKGLETVQGALEAACMRQIAGAEAKSSEARVEMQHSRELLDNARVIEQERQHALEEAERALQEAKQALQEAQQALESAQADLESAQSDLNSAESDLSACQSQPPNAQGIGPCCTGEMAAVAQAANAVASAQTAVVSAQNALSEAEAALAEAETAKDEAEKALEKATENRMRMEQRVEIAGRALGLAEQLLERTQQYCSSGLNIVSGIVQIGKARLLAAHNALENYLATNQPAASFYSWLRWQPDRSCPITPDVIRDRINLSQEQQNLLHEYLYERKPAFRKMTDKFRAEWAGAKGDVERNIVNRKVRINLSGAYAEEMVLHALAPLGGKVETQGITYVGDGGRYTKTDVLVSNLYAPVILGKGQNMGAPAGGSMAFEVKCGKADYLYAQIDHMVFQAEGHKQADAHCTLCSRDIHDLPVEKEKEIREKLRVAGSPMVGMLPRKNDIDQSCLDLIIRRTDKE